MNKEDLIKHIAENLEKALPENLEYLSPSIHGYFIGTTSEGGGIEDNLEIEIKVKLKTKYKLSKDY